MQHNKCKSFGFFERFSLFPNALRIRHFLKFNILCHFHKRFLVTAKRDTKILHKPQNHQNKFPQRKTIFMA